MSDQHQDPFLEPAPLAPFDPGKNFNEALVESAKELFGSIERTKKQ